MGKLFKISKFIMINNQRALPRGSIRPQKWADPDLSSPFYME